MVLIITTKSYNTNHLLDDVNKHYILPLKGEVLCQFITYIIKTRYMDVNR
jgi:hypothetical protein